MLQGKGVVAGLKANGMYGKKPVVAAAQRRSDRQQLVPVQERVRLDPQPAVQERHVQEGPGAVRAGLGQPEGRTIFEQMLVKTSNKIDGVAAANDGLANAVVVALKARKLKPDPAERSGCDGAGRAEHHLRLADR